MGTYLPLQIKKLFHQKYYYYYIDTQKRKNFHTKKISLLLGSSNIIFQIKRFHKLKLQMRVMRLATETLLEKQFYIFYNFTYSMLRTYFFKMI